MQKIEDALVKLLNQQTQILVEIHGMTHSAQRGPITKNGNIKNIK